MRSDSIFGYVKLLLVLFSVLVLVSIGYSGYILFQDMQAQKPRLTYNVTHITIEGLTIKNRGFYPINLSLAIQVIGDGQVVSESRVSRKVMPGESKDLPLSLPIPLNLEYGNVTLNFLVDFGLPPFVHLTLNFSQPISAVTGGLKPSSLAFEEDVRLALSPSSFTVKSSEGYQQIGPYPIYAASQAHVKDEAAISGPSGQSHEIWRR
jgi:hypothetical protein